MEKRKAFELKSIMVVYNAIQVIANVLLVVIVSLIKKYMNIAVYSVFHA